MLNTCIVVSRHSDFVYELNCQHFSVFNHPDFGKIIPILLVNLDSCIVGTEKH